MTARIGITLGDPSGIGPEIIVAALQHNADLRARCVVYGDHSVLERCGFDGGFDVDVHQVTTLSPDDCIPGRPNAAGAGAQIAYLEAAVAAAKRGEIKALVTAPISKEQVASIGFEFPGHTEFLAARFSANEVAMLFVGPRLRVILATVHVALADVARTLCAKDIARAISLGGSALVTHMGIERPRIGIVGLNPHAGEHGLFGHEEQSIIVPGLALGRQRLTTIGIDAELGGPLVPDAAFRAALDGRWDLLVAMYHDQGLIPVKLVDFEDSVNVTLGLPIVRTSPDHGVAYDIAGQGRARPQSFVAALKLAANMADHQ